MKVKKESSINIKQAEKYKDAEVVYRDKTGRKITHNDLIEQSYEHQRKKLESMNEKRIREWSRGVVQTVQSQMKKREFEKLKCSSFANKDISSQADQEMREKARFDDPMQSLIANDVHTYFLTLKF